MVILLIINSESLDKNTTEERKAKHECQKI